MKLAHPAERIEEIGVKLVSLGSRRFQICLSIKRPPSHELHDHKDRVRARHDVPVGAVREDVGNRNRRLNPNIPRRCSLGHNLLPDEPQGRHDRNPHHLRFIKFFDANKETDVLAPVLPRHDFTHPVAAVASRDQLAYRAWLNRLDKAPVVRDVLLLRRRQCSPGRIRSSRSSALRASASASAASLSI